MIRIGQGYDCHAFQEGDHIVLGGIHIPFEKGLRAHSDGDVLLHALTDALLGALSVGDIGQHFPDTDPRFRGVASREFVIKTMKMLEERHYRILNIDSTVITESPKLKKYMDSMRKNIAELLKCPVDTVNIKAKTNEKMGWIGRGEGLAAIVVVIITSQNY